LFIKPNAFENISSLLEKHLGDRIACMQKWRASLWAVTMLMCPFKMLPLHRLTFIQL